MGACRLKKCSACDLGVRFYWGQYEECDLGDRSSDSSEKLLQRCRVKKYICDFGKVGVHAI